MVQQADIYRPALTPKQPPSAQMQALQAKHAQARAQADALGAQIKSMEASERMEMEKLAKMGAAGGAIQPQPGGMMPIPPNAPVPAGPSFGPMTNPAHPAPAMNQASPGGGGPMDVWRNRPSWQAMPPGVQGQGISPEVMQMLMQGMQR